MRKTYTTEEKNNILARVAEIGAAAAAKEAGASYNSVLRWVKESKQSLDGAVEAVSNAVKTGEKKISAHPEEILEKIRAEIEIKEEEIKEIEESLKLRKNELKELQRAKVKAEKEKEAFEEAEQKKQLVEAIMKSGRSAEEIINFLNS